MISLLNGDIIEKLKELPLDQMFHAVISDPPYGLSFMGKSWDKYTPKEYQQWVTEWASELMLHLYPGAVCAFFGGTRTYHRLASGLEDAGFEIFDSMIWCYGSGFPKSYNLSKGIDKSKGLEREIIDEVKGKGRMSGDSDYQTNDYGKSWNGVKITEHASTQAHQWNGYGTALKPAYEPVVLCRKPRESTYVNSALDYGTGALNIDGCRIGTELLKAQNEGKQSMYGENRTVFTPERQGRFPANLALICACEREPCVCVERELIRTRK